MDLSILIPARNEEFLARTIDDILKNIRGETEVIAVLDGNWADPPIPNHERVTIIYHSESIGQRAAQNEAAKLSRAKYVMKVDAHCAFAKGFDVEMIKGMRDDWTMVPLMKNLHAFDWVCTKCEWREYQGPTPKKCPKCGAEVKKEIIWKPRPGRENFSYRFNKELRFKYFGQYKERQKGDLVQTMSLQGSCFMCTREKYWELGLCDESWGSWGQQGTEVAIKTWLSGGEVRANKKTWYAHLFRTRPGFNWPYPPPPSQKRAREICKDLFFNNKWPLAKHDLQWLIDKFAPVPDWHEEKGEDKPSPPKTPPPTKKKPTKGVIYYTDNRLDEKVMRVCQRQILRGIKEKHIVSASLKPIKFGKNIHLPLKRGYLTMFKQILAALEASTADIIFHCEHDVMYHPSHFDFIPPSKWTYYYNLNVWKVRIEDGHALKVDDCKQTSGLCAWRELLVEHYRKRVAKVLRNQADLTAAGKPIKNEGFSLHMGFEPGQHTPPRGVDEHKSASWMSKHPNVDIRHTQNLTPNRWSKDLFRDQRFTEGWTEAEEIPGWGKFKEFFGGKVWK